MSEGTKYPPQPYTLGLQGLAQYGLNMGKGKSLSPLPPASAAYVLEVKILTLYSTAAVLHTC